MNQITEQSIENIDLQLLSQLKNGSDHALTILFKKYVQTLYNYGRSITAIDAVIEDGIQEIFLDLWKKRENIEIRNIKFYLLKALRNQILQRLIKEKREVKNGSYSELSKLYSNELPAIDEAENLAVEEDNISHIRNLINKLPERQREVIILKYYEGLEYDQIAEILAINIPSIYNLIYKAISFLRKHLKNDPITLSFFLFIVNISTKLI